MRQKAGLVLIFLGVLGSIPSMFQTFSHVGDSGYELTAFEREADADPIRVATHARYHAFREFLLSVSVVIVIVWLMWLAQSRQDSHAWWIALILGVGYTLGWWLPWPFYGLRAPHLVAESVHAVATFGLLSGILLAKARGAGR